MIKLSHVSSSLRSSLSPKPIFKLTLNVEILETHLQKCRILKHFDQILSQMVLTGLLKDTYAASILLKFSVDSYFVHVDHSRRIFRSIENSNAFIWNTMMRAYVQRNFPCKALRLYKWMLCNRVCTDNRTFPIIVQASALRLSEFEGKQLHDHVLKVGFDSDVYVQNTLVNMYSVCGNMKDARKLFDESPVLDSVSWNSILAGYVRSGNVGEAISIYEKMTEKNVIASNSMIKLFCEKGLVAEARKVFDEMPMRDLVSWSALVSCYEKNLMYKDAVATFISMNSYGVTPDEVTMISVLSACANLSEVWLGGSLHAFILKTGTESFVNLQNALIKMYTSCGGIKAAEKLFSSSHCLDQFSWNSMISGYMKCGLVDKAEELFDMMPNKDVVSWSAMISGYVQNDWFYKALEMFQELQLRGIKPDETILVTVITACTRMNALEHGERLHSYIKENDLHINPILGTALINMYMECGCPETALDIFCGIHNKGVSTWNALIDGLAMHGLVGKSLLIFSEMKHSEVKPNEITFLNVLSACRHAGLVDEGRCHFSSMVNEYEIEPNVKHYGCMIDLLGRAGLLREAEEIIETMPVAPDVATWGALLGAYVKHGNSELGERLGRKLVERYPDHDGFCVLLSHIYASKGDWGAVLEIRGAMSGNSVQKIPGLSVVCKETNRFPRPITDVQ
ncbi:PREDICTED: pentatricopeptide repeat-containing protein At2g22410, mitochondrial-like [Tarenaya hassleriana]|uniref:pentatricopeptide repeat-containing protein At2g22410, mitochondrial-like n=1 Tax=Tarenaya hassleriana TaxID=28532 RepID=UPI00053C7CF6|nr:PREDICTED: pentatricopeptide repeat-containing protein At2g22410, mitochondrial-like [Tarenaya hassleriana]